MSWELEFLLKYPSVMATGASAFRGYVTVNDILYPITIKENADRTYSLKFTPELLPYEFPQPMQNPVQILDKLTALISAGTKPYTPIDTGIYRRIISDYIELRNFHINIASSKIEANLSAIDVVCEDMRKRHHNLSIRVNFSGGKLYKLHDCELPGNLEWETATLEEMYTLFVAEVESCQDFFNVMDEIDKRCWVLDPAHPKRSDRHRRIALNEKLSVLVTLNPPNVKQMPNMKFLGPKIETDAITERMDEWMNSRSDELNWDGDILEEILIMLGLEDFPKRPQNSGIRDEQVLLNASECCICFTMRLNDELPQIVCPNAKCSQFFHRECLFQWLAMCTSGRTFFHEIWGDCPNCEKPIRCSRPDNMNN